LCRDNGTAAGNGLYRGITIIKDYVKPYSPARNTPGCNATPVAAGGDPAAVAYTADMSGWFEDADGDTLFIAMCNESLLPEDLKERFVLHIEERSEILSD
jgi:hypothetical protein